jgi:thiamine pyrophosphate-dependent acetolactate synthase large subunit-like protein
VTWVVFNNQAFGWPQYTQFLKKQEFVATAFGVATDLVAIARAQGCEALRVEDPDKVEEALEKAREANTRGVPMLLDIHIARHDYTPHFQAVHKLRIHD